MGRATFVDVEHQVDMAHMKKRDGTVSQAALWHLKSEILIERHVCTHARIGPISNLACMLLDVLPRSSPYLVESSLSPWYLYLSTSCLLILTPLLSRLPLVLGTTYLRNWFEKKNVVSIAGYAELVSSAAAAIPLFAITALLVSWTLLSSPALPLVNELLIFILIREENLTTNWYIIDGITQPYRQILCNTLLSLLLRSSTFSIFSSLF